jgi:hypothetical protein
MYVYLIYYCSGEYGESEPFPINDGPQLWGSETGQQLWDDNITSLSLGLEWHQSARRRKSPRHWLSGGLS